MNHVDVDDDLSAGVGDLSAGVGDFTAESSSELASRFGGSCVDIIDGFGRFDEVDAFAFFRFLFFDSVFVFPSARACLNNLAARI